MVLTKVKQAGVTVYYADRRVTTVWNKGRDNGDPAHFGGWYWNRSKGRQVLETDTSGPFKSQSAAVRDAYMKLQLRHTKHK